MRERVRVRVRVGVRVCARARVLCVYKNRYINLLPTNNLICPCGERNGGLVFTIHQMILLLINIFC